MLRTCGAIRLMTSAMAASILGFAVSAEGKYIVLSSPSAHRSLLCQLRRDHPPQNSVGFAAELLHFDADHRPFCHLDLQLGSAEQPRGQGAEQRFVPC